MQADSILSAREARESTQEETRRPLPSTVTAGPDDAIVSPAPCNVGMEQSMPRRQYQRGGIISRGKKRKVWIGIFREDRVKADVTIHRARRSVVLGPYLDAVNLVAILIFQCSRIISSRESLTHSTCSFARNSSTSSTGRISPHLWITEMSSTQLELRLPTPA